MTPRVWQTVKQFCLLLINEPWNAPTSTRCRKNDVFSNQHFNIWNNNDIYYLQSYTNCKSCLLLVFSVTGFRFCFVYIDNKMEKKEENTENTAARKTRVCIFQYSAFCYCYIASLMFIYICIYIQQLDAFSIASTQPHYLTLLVQGIKSDGQ